MRAGVSGRGLTPRHKFAVTTRSPSLADSPLTAISVAPPRGALTNQQGQVVQGRLFGPGVFPLALARVLEAVESGVPVVSYGR